MEQKKSFNNRKDQYTKGLRHFKIYSRNAKISLSSDTVQYINRLLFKFLWKKRYNNKKAFEKVKRRTLCTQYLDGGLKMLDIKRLQESFILDRVKNLLKGKMEIWKAVPLYFVKKVGGISAFMSPIQPKKIKGFELISSQYWRRALELWLEFTHEDNAEYPKIYQPIFNNAYITYKGRESLSRHMYQ